MRAVVREGHRPDLSDLPANRDWLAGDDARLVPAAGNVARIMTDAGLLRRTPPLDGLADPRFLPES